MILGITFEEKILKEIKLKEYMGLMNSYSITLLELAPNFIDYDIDFYIKIFQEIKENSLQFNFHLPSFVDEKLSIDNFRESHKEYYKDYFKKLNQIFNLKKNLATVVFHGAKYEDDTKAEAINKTLSVIDFLLKLFSENNYQLTLAIETLNKNKHKIIGDSRKDLKKILDTVDSPRLKICWDITHDFLNFGEILCPKGQILNAISHCHVHGFKDNQTHLSLNENFQLFPAIKFAKKNNIPINIELLMQDNYLDILKKDLSTVQSIT
jgi:sugar phosphate isomerase/epimerase